MAGFGKSTTPGGQTTTPGGNSVGGAELIFDRVVVAYGEMLGCKLYRLKPTTLFIAAL